MILNLLQSYIPEFGLISQYAKSKSLSAISAAANRLIIADDYAMQELASLAGVHLRLVITQDPESLHPASHYNVFIFPEGPDLPIAILASLPENDTHQEDSRKMDSEAPRYEPDATVQGSLIELVQFIRQEKNIAKSGLRISGNPAILQRLKDIAKQIKFDWAGLLSQYTGPEIAGVVERTAKSTKDQFDQQASQLPENVRSLLQNETKLLPYREQFSHFTDRVYEASNSVERLEARIRLIQQRILG